jgi:osmoprotectant transport system permease protein
MHKYFLFLLFLLLNISNTSFSKEVKKVVVASKKFTESYILAEIASKSLEKKQIPFVYKQGIGGTLILWQALSGGAIDTYPEYTGTIEQEILKTNEHQSINSLRQQLYKKGIGITEPLGFNNTYALGIRKGLAKKLHIKNISDLQKFPDLKFALSHEFIARSDGWKPLSQHYSLKNKVQGIDHTLAYQALSKGTVDVVDIYSTDAKIESLKLFILNDNLKFFPKYEAVFLYRLNLPQKAIKELNQLAGKFSEAKMIRLNLVAEESKSYSKAANLFFTSQVNNRNNDLDLLKQITHWTWQHLCLVSVSMMLAIMIGIPLGIIANYSDKFGLLILNTVSIIQTIPSLALLALLVPIPFLGISSQTAILALFLYSLLPIVRNTTAGLQNIPNSLKESAQALGLEPWAKLWKIYLPLASPTILAGIKTSTIINIGTATLAALIGAGGLGEPIISGLNLNDTKTILMGAVPAALLALLVQWLFEFIDQQIIPKGLLNNNTSKQEP